MNLQERYELFISKAKSIHGNLYDYTKVVYVNSTSKITIKCNNCQQIFDQAPMSHISSSNPCGCPHCRYQRMSKPQPRTTLNTTLFIEKAKSIHGTKYNYDQVNYINSHTKVHINCITHGTFMQTPNNHTSLKQGCPSCGVEAKRTNGQNKRLLLSEFVSRANIRYSNVYDYSKSEYISSSLPITITCRVHGDFTVARAEKHLFGQECPTCCKTNGSSYELRINNWLTMRNISFQREKTFDDCLSPISGRKLKYDFYIPSIRTLIEFDGIQHFKPIAFFNQSYTFEKGQVHDLVKTQYATDNSYSLLRLTVTTLHLLETLIPLC